MTPAVHNVTLCPTAWDLHDAYLVASETGTPEEMTKAWSEYKQHINSCHYCAVKVKAKTDDRDHHPAPGL